MSTKHLLSRESLNTIVSILRFIPDKPYLKMMYRLRVGKKLNLKNPITFNEKLQWLKLYDRKPEYSMMVDKYEVKDYVANIIGNEHIIPTLGVWDSFEQIPFADLPEQFVLKCTHDSGGLIICKDRSKFDIRLAKKIINRSLKTNYYWLWREWPYKNVRPRIIAEQYMEDANDGELRDYKFFSFDGRVEALFIASDRTNPKEETKFDFYDINFNHLDFRNGHPNSNKHIQKPINFEKMIHFAELLSKGLPEVRVDFYEVNGKVYFGEMTFFHFSGLKAFDPEKWDTIFGSWIELQMDS